MKTPHNYLKPECFRGMLGRDSLTFNWYYFLGIPKLVGLAKGENLPNFMSQKATKNAWAFPRVFGLFVFLCLDLKGRKRKKTWRAIFRWKSNVQNNVMSLKIHPFTRNGWWFMSKICQVSSFLHSMATVGWSIPRFYKKTTWSLT